MGYGTLTKVILIMEVLLEPLRSRYQLPLAAVVSHQVLEGILEDVALIWIKITHHYR